MTVLMSHGVLSDFKDAFSVVPAFFPVSSSSGSPSAAPGHDALSSAFAQPSVDHFSSSLKIQNQAFSEWFLTTEFTDFTDEPPVFLSVPSVKSVVPFFRSLPAKKGLIFKPASPLGVM